jgi:hypothetical protein
MVDILFMPTWADDPETSVPNTLPVTFAVLLSECWFVMVVTVPMMLLVWLLTVVLTASFSLQLSEIGPAGPAPHVTEIGLNTIVQLSLKSDPAGNVLVSMLRARFCVFWPVNAEAGIPPKMLVKVKVLKSADSKTEEYCRLARLPVPVATWRLIEVLPELVIEPPLTLAKAPS